MIYSKKVLSIFCAAIIILLNFKVSYAYKQEDLFNEAIKVTEGNVVEYGIKTSFKSSIDGQELVKYFIKKMPKEYNANIIAYKNNNYVMDFKNNKDKLYLIIGNLDGESKVILNIIEKNNENELGKLNEKINNLISEVVKDEKVQYQYLRVRIPKRNLKNINEKIINILKNKGAINVESIKLNNGFSTCAYTRKYNAKVINGKNIDFNFALCKYSSGNYMILGTPEIITTY